MNQHQTQDEYIEILEARCEHLEDENESLKAAIAAMFNAVRMQTAGLNGCIQGIVGELFVDDEDDGESGPLSQIAHAQIQ